jgi:tRNA-uridine 2-sulfurtransferase
MKPAVAVALSGGVDSLVAAYLLKEQGFQVIGLHFITGYESGLKREKNLFEKGTSITPSEILRAETEKKIDILSDQLDIPVYIVNLQDEFQQYVVNRFIDTYRAGKTPNPCLVCNPYIKFGFLMEYALKLGAIKLATGHYARIQKDSENNFHLLKGVDSHKDQSYFLAFMNQVQLGQACFPLGNMTKSEVRQVAVQNNLVPLTQKESQDVCFIRDLSYGEFLARYFSPKPGSIEDTSGNVIGKHKGLHLFTIGQRRGINCPASEPYYVVEIDMNKNRLVVGFKNELFRKECRVEAINWIHHVPEVPLVVHTRVRYRHRAEASKVIPLDKQSAVVRFEIFQEAVTPGQGAVFYLNDEVIGAGWIAKENQ